MKRVRLRALTMNLTLAFLLLLIILCIIGAFMGTERAAVFFNSPPLGVFWILLAVLFVTGFTLWKPLWRRPNLLLCHAGCVAVLLGGLWGSEASHRLRETAGLSPKLTKGMLMLRPGQASHHVMLQDQTGTFELPFKVHMIHTSVAHYDEPSIGIHGKDNRLIGLIPAVVGDAYELMPGSDILVQVVQRFDNLRIVQGEDGIKGVEGERDRYNPGYEVVYGLPDGQLHHQYLYELFEPHITGEFPFVARYWPARIPREYRSTLKIEADGQFVKAKSIRVNDPLYYGGYHFYQSTFGQDEYSHYSGIQVVSDSGVWWVFFGYALLTAGLFGQFWVKPLRDGRIDRGEA